MRQTPSRIIASTLLTVLLAGCAVGPNYKRPAIDTPQTFRGAPTETLSAAPFGDEKWSEVFQDPELQTLIRTALQQNYDVRIAAARIAQAQAQVSYHTRKRTALRCSGPEEQWQPECPVEVLRPIRNKQYWNLGLVFSGISTSGESIAVPRKPRGLNCWPAIGRGEK